MGGTNAANLRDILARNIRVLRHQLDLSQEELGERAGLHRTYIGGVERGERNLTVDNIEKIANALRVTPDRLLANNLAD